MHTALEAAVRGLGGDFLAGAFGRTCQHWSQVADFSGLLTWDDLNEILGRHRLDAPRLRLFRAGVQVPPYKYLHSKVTKRLEVRQHVIPAALHRQIAAGASLVVDAMEGLHPGVADLAESLERHFHTDVQVNMYASWTSTEGFGIHWDDHDTVIFQLEGSKRWRLYGQTRPNPLRDDIEAPAEPDAEAFTEIMLRAGDMLYVPRGCWHAVAATEGRSLHLTCGLTPATGQSLLQWLSRQLTGSATLRASLPVHASPADQTAYVEALRKEVTEALHPNVLAEYLESLDACDPGRPFPSLPHIETVPADEALILRLTTARASYHVADSGIVFRAAGQEWTLSAQTVGFLEPLVAGKAVPLGDLARRSGITLDQAAALATELVTSDAAAVTGK
ncbi:cupin domain-containing protein [Streptomyces sp. NPDC001674]|uniref:cupin domain-containing protein n=1 Tax=Streptomyces sp. NPDC001674 TaxID=3154394 RepID=UPI003322482C